MTFTSQESASLSLVTVSDLHLVFHLALLGRATSDFVIDNNIKVSIISGVGSTVKGALNDISFLRIGRGQKLDPCRVGGKTHGNSEGFRGVKDSLFPVGVLSMTLALLTV